MKKFSVIGAGSWGTALAIFLARKGFDVVLWARNADFAKSIARSRENFDYLPGVRFPDMLGVTADLSDALLDRDIVVFAVPSHGVRRVAEAASGVLGAAPALSLPKAIVSATKGIENETLLTMTGVLSETFQPALSSRLAVLSGPSFAKEVAVSIPTAITLACYDRHLCIELQRLFFAETFRVYTSQDVIGVELGGALKNVIAIAVGISDGMGFGANTRAALITRGLAEMTRLGVRLGANPLTFAGLAGLGDLVLTCTGDLSRNRQVGLKLGRGIPIAAILDDMKMVAEGIKSSRSAHILSEKYRIEMPITTQVYSVIYKGKDPRDAVRELLSRPLNEELCGL
ncbi:MAG: NAD(P)H-dependent glycerol-3-phosphate dehydrogenase [Dissulfurimicrobium sp.]|uniref:NAD(P)H-dependent glycerol-3-phosphate dehydrogenase n=1 Tax=Dissulfurimicrobium sp. TaxID=2022436 RepID=UPI004049A26C